MFQQRLAVVSERPVSSPEVSWPHQLTSAIKPWANPPAPSPLFLYPCMLSLPCQQRVSLEKPIKTFSPFTRHMFNCWLLKKKKYQTWGLSWKLVAREEFFFTCDHQHISHETQQRQFIMKTATFGLQGLSCTSRVPGQELGAKKKNPSSREGYWFLTQTTSHRTTKTTQKIQQRTLQGP